MKNIKIIATGAQGTGKTTVLNMFNEAQYPVITEVVRNLVKSKGISINQDGTADTQRAVFNEYIRVLGDTEKYISDRGLTDVISYTLAGVQDGKISEEVYKEQLEATKNFVLAHPDILYVYFPIEFPVVADGVRSVDENYRSQIDQLIKKHLDELGIDYLTVTGTPQERFCQILDWIGPDLF